MTDLTHIWVVIPPKVEPPLIQWPIQLHREEFFAREALHEHHKVGIDSDLKRLCVYDEDGVDIQRLERFKNYILMHYPRIWSEAMRETYER